MKKLLALILAILMITTMFVACAREDDDNDKSDKKHSVSIKGDKDEDQDKGEDTNDKISLWPSKDNDKNEDNDGNKDQEENEDSANAETSANEIVVGYTIYAPMNYKDDTGTLVGFDTELSIAVFENLGYNVVFKEIEWSNKYNELNEGTIDCIWNGFVPNVFDDDGVNRKLKVDTSYNYLKNQQVVVVKKDSGIKTAADLVGKTGAVEVGSAGEYYGYDFDGASIKHFSTQADCLMEVFRNTADFAVLDTNTAKELLKKEEYADLKIVEDLSSEAEYYAVAFKIGSKLTDKVNQEFERLAADGTIARLGAKYGLSGSVITDFSNQHK